MDQQLRWIEYNRTALADGAAGHGPRQFSGRCRRPARGQRQGETALASKLALELLDARAARAGASERARAVLAEHAGPDLLREVTALRLHGCVLTLEVAEPALLYHLRLRWEQRLLDLMRRHLPDTGITAVCFRAGRRS